MPINPDENIDVSQIDGKRFDFKSFRESQLEPLGDLWAFERPLSENLITLIHKTVILPHANLQAPLFAAYILIPSALASIVPVCLCQGLRGSGKTNLLMISSGLHNSPIVSVGSSFASVRNQFADMRWGDIHERKNSDETIERNCCLIFDNVSRDTLLNEDIYMMLLNGYNRKTDAISIAKPGGENSIFKVFGLKILSSVYPVYVESKFSELSRRCIVIKCKPFETMTLSEKCALDLEPGFVITEKLNLESIDLRLLHKAFNEFWENKINILDYVDIKRQLTSRKNKVKLPASFDGAKWTICIDLLTTGVVTGIWESIDDGISFLDEYWSWYNLNIATSFGATHKVLSDLIAEETATAVRTNEQLKYEAMPLEINPEKVKKRIAYAASMGMLEISPTPSTIAEIMADLGWRLDKGKSGQVVWMPQLK